MTKVFSFANQKGGVGKSSLSIQAAFYLASKKKKKVLVVDMDAQGNTSSRLAPRVVDEKGSFEPTLYGTKTADLFKENLNGLEIMECPHGIDLIHTPQNDPELFEMEAADLDKALNPKRHLASIFENYDYVIIDCPPSLGRNLVAALVMTTHVVCPVKLSGFAIDGVEGLLSTIIGIRENQNNELNIVGIIINDMDRSVNHERSLKVLQDAIPEMMFKNKIMHRPPLDTAITDGKPIWELPYGHVAAREVETVMRELLERAK
ncbi:MAG: cobalamin biosynthesis protein CobQ [Gammaproteobacteria bacterium TMED95]|nr:MAG: cobalamin biosynthesis protein CobQ [Gammaproteobacteria bacterium TMED95]